MAETESIYRQIPCLKVLYVIT